MLLKVVLVLVAYLHLTSGTSYLPVTAATCQAKYQKVGCYERNKNLFGTLLLNHRDGGESVTQIDWKDFQGSMRRLSCECAVIAKAKGYTHFAITFYAECWGTRAEEEFKKSITSSKCIHDYGKICNNAEGNDKMCGGTKEEEYVYTVLKEVDGGFTNWSKFGSCTKTCGGGTQVRNRSCTNPSPANGGKECGGAPFETRQCNTIPCPVDGGFSKWSKFGACTKSCGGGIQERRRSCTNPKPMYGGKPCTGLFMETRKCNTISCPDYVCNWVDGDGTGGSENYIGKYGAAECAKKCAEKSLKDRSINGATHGRDGLSCYCEKSMTGIRTSTAWRTCFIKSTIKVNGGFSNWSKFGACTKSCGGGTQVRNRSCTNPKPMNGGKPCTGLFSETRKCNTMNCPDYVCNWIDADGTGGSENYIGKYGAAECIKKCAEKSEKDPTINGVTHGREGLSCYCEKEMTGTRSSTAWKTCFIKSTLKVDGGFSNWSKVGECTKSCGGGTQQVRRSCTNPKPMNGGKPCSGLFTETRKCNTMKCPDYTCNWVDGDGRGGSESFIGNYGPAECVKKCAEKSVKDPSINGATHRRNGLSCYCEKGMTTTKSSTVWRTCFIKSTLKVDGGFSNWSKFGACTKSCGGGTQEVRRSCTNPKPMNGGKPCRGLFAETRKCNTMKCPDYTCNWVDGDGRGGSESFIGKYGPAECVKKCAEKSVKDPTINGATHRREGLSCYCEKRMTNIKSSRVWRTCFIKSTLLKDFDCNWVDADGTGGTKSYIGTYEPAECVKKCALKSVKDPSINGATHGRNARSCFCEKRMTGTKKSTTWRTCFVKSKSK